MEGNNNSLAYDSDDDEDFIGVGFDDVVDDVEELPMEKPFTGKKKYISDTIHSLLNEQIHVEFNASQLYKAIASWSEYKGYEGTAKFFNKHVDEERKHMQKLYEYILDRQALPTTPMVDEQPLEFIDLKDVLEQSLKHEEYVELTYRTIIPKVLEECDYTTFTFLQFFLNEQIEEIKLIAGLLDRLEVVGYDNKGMFFLDQEIGEL